MLGRWSGRRSNGSGREMTRRGMEDEEEQFGELMSRPFVGLQRQINRVFDEFFDDLYEDFPLTRPEMGRRMMGSGGRGTLGMSRFSPHLDLSETGESFKITVDVPGMSEDDIEITVSDNTLMLSGDRSMEREKEDENYYRRERSYGMFRRRIPLPENIERDKISATFKNGVLTIDVPKNEEAQKNWRKIEVKSES